MTDEERAVHNERTRLLATYFNNLAVALVAIGALAPLAGAVVGTSAPWASTLAVLVFGCLAASVALHLLARNMAGRIKP